MRLTLRTMLAYLDDVLDPADAQELGARISESEFASELVHRVRSSARKMRLSAPELEEQGVGAELNSVADYLDNVLPEEQLSDFEQVCLESDVHLAEVTCCHQILTLVLGEPAVVSDDVRQRVYRVDSEHREWRPPSQQDTVSDSKASVVQPPPVVMGTEASQSDVPDFMKPTRSIRLWHLGVIGVVAVVMLLAFPAVRSQLGWLDEAGQEVAQQNEDAGADSGAPASTESGGPVASATDGAAVPPVVAQAADSVVDPGSAAELEAANPSATSSSVPAESTPVATTAQPLGKLVSPNQLLLRWNSEEQVFEPVAVDAALNAGDHLLVPPGFRAQIALASGLQMTVMGHATWKWVATKGAGPRLVLSHGRFVFSREGESAEPVAVNCAGRSSWLALPKQDSQVAVELWRYLPPGKDPRVAVGEIALRAYQLAGGCWAEEQSDLTAEKPSGVVCSRTLGQQALEQMVVETSPGWISSGKQAGSFDEIATVALAEAISSEEPLILQLQTLQASHRLHEVRALTARLLAALGEYDAILESFHDKAYRASWEKHFGLLRDLVARHPDTAVGVQMAFERQRGDDGEHLFRLIWGYDSAQLEAESAGLLVEWLSDEAIDTRVLAFSNLKRITGKTQLFFPEKPIGQQSTAIRGWTRLLEEGSIVPAQDPTPWNQRSELLNP